MVRIFLEIGRHRRLANDCRPPDSVVTESAPLAANAFNLASPTIASTWTAPALLSTSSLRNALRCFKQGSTRLRRAPPP